MKYTIPKYVAQYIDKRKAQVNNLLVIINHLITDSIEDWLKEKQENVLIFCQYYIDPKKVNIEDGYRYIIKCPKDWVSSFSDQYVNYNEQNKVSFCSKEFATLFTKEKAEDLMKKMNISWELVEVD